MFSYAFISGLFIQPLRSCISSPVTIKSNDFFLTLVQLLKGLKVVIITKGTDILNK